jgi:hypothetical protein
VAVYEMDSLAHDRGRWRTFVNAAITLRVSQKAADSSTIRSKGGRCLKQSVSINMRHRKRAEWFPELLLLLSKVSNGGS